MPLHGAGPCSPAAEPFPACTSHTSDWEVGKRQELFTACPAPLATRLHLVAALCLDLDELAESL